MNATLDASTDFERATDPFPLFDRWMADAEQSEPNDPNAVCLATATPDGRPAARIVLLKSVDPRGFVFHSHYTGRKGEEMAANPQVALCFHWKTLHRQVRVEGRVERASAEESDSYYASRARTSRLGAWASRQSQPLRDRAELEAALREVEARFPGEDVPRPEHWGGFRVVPTVVEFWQDAPYRLHDRRVFTRTGEGWATQRLYP
ncbi:pyridoxamine 5'-phosphate oxidase [Roseomonas elaeocarpi]|uniref:Pyridoxine/pyridoxamine 5'-phosphate oxidase n=1 Tax=Roseomonas elaeocarpi TaxID=907779 RepID=A0ABV6JUQ2_9PROT